MTDIEEQTVIYQAMCEYLTEAFEGTSSRLGLTLNLPTVPRRLSALLQSMAPGLKQLGWGVDRRPYGALQLWVIEPPGWKEQQKAEQAADYAARIAAGQPIPPWVDQDS